MAGVNLGAEIQGMVSSLQRENPNLSMAARIKRAWNESVDNNIAEHVTAVFVVPNTDDSEVIVYIDNSHVATNLTMQSDLLRLNLNIRLNEDEGIPSVHRKAEQVEKLTFRVSKERYIPRERRMTTLQRLEEEEKRYRKATPIALDADERAYLEEAISQIDDDVLRESAYAAAVANLEWQKGVQRYVQS